METDNKLFNNIQSKVSVTLDDFESLKRYFIPLKAKKKTNVIDEGNYNDCLYFVEKGLLYSYKTLESGDVQVIQFAAENYWLSDLCSFFTGSAALFSIQALEDSSLYKLSKNHFDEICASHPDMETFFRLQFQSAYANTLIRLSDAYSLDTKLKYDKFRMDHPDLLQRIPQYLVASFLGVLPSSLSRIRSIK